MSKQKPLHLFMTFMPIAILLIISVYFSNIAWNDYSKNKNFQASLANVKLLQAYKNSVLEESLCKLLLPKGSKKISTVCKERIQRSITLEKSLKNRKENLQHWKHQISSIKENSTHKGISNFQTYLGKENVVSILNSYLNKAEYKTENIEEKELLQIYSLLSNIAYGTNLEYFLVRYYMSKKIPLSTNNMIFWDKIIETSYLLNIKDKKNISSIKERLTKILENKTLQTSLGEIDEMRIAILTKNMQNSKKKSTWIKHLDTKRNALEQMISIVETEFKKRVGNHINKALIHLIIYLSIILLSLIAFLYFLFQHKQNTSKSYTLNNLMNKIHALDPHSNKASDEIQSTLEYVKSEEDIYNYIYEYFQLLNQKSKDMEQEIQSKGHLLSTLSHEIRTPLNGIIGFSKLLRDIGVSSDQEEFLSLIEGSSRNLISILNDVLDLSKINADKMEIEDISFNIFEAVESTVATFTQQAVQKDIELAVFIDPFLSHYFLGDATKLSQILTNLIGNAVKFTNPYGKINIFVQSTHHNEKEAEIKFSISDDGIGLSKEQIKNIFNPFTQATKGTSNKYGGTGLGLTISRKMVELMGGKLEVTSKQDEGATFVFSLTLKKDTDNVAEPHPHFKDIHVGLALPVKSIKRQLDTNLAIYIRYLGGKFSFYYYEDLFENDGLVDLPDIMIFDHHYARLVGELEQCSSLNCATVILTDGSLHSRIDPDRHHFDDIIFTPMSIGKSIRILENTKEEEEEFYSQPSKTLENIESFIGLHALVADDNLINRKLIKIILEKSGLTVTLASNGEEALEKNKEYTFDIIFMDIQMPVMDGVEATNKIIKYEKENNITHVPIIALTANVARGDKERYLAEGMDDYATKPLDVRILKLIISKHCGVGLTSKNKEK